MDEVEELRNDADNDSENDVAKEFQPTSTVYDLHGQKINTELVIFNVTYIKKYYFIISLKLKPNI